MMVPERSAQNSRPSAAKASATGKLAATLPPGSRLPAAQNATEAGGGAAGRGAGGGGRGGGAGGGRGGRGRPGDGGGEWGGERAPTPERRPRHAAWASPRLARHRSS